ncbi:23S rRNA (cytidine(2498)-2'-O)-methyltransferase RlmM [Plasticicumulans acidivorans]|uniref:Ribosomal RNA large subunit methyltransferase M n=1 Tax=Plasticicumulans acidivorans TaxID=886464 RepID=A0A317MXK5_9GAMM|nr:23S rRNA (cytidine(2498)-2'-O)-methyltransferase RlmM [Plasticicumulans acidivorans]PWV64370.1 23S rRNA (cytidine2498-2'-O)-methyltransferase [Plasticicumulans acidivorans]
MSLPTLLLYCRPGFEGECAAEITELAAALGFPGYVKAKPDSACVSFHPYAGDALALLRALDFQQLIFARQMIACAELLRGLPVDDRITPLLATARTLGATFAEVHIETPDTNEAKALSSFCRPFTKAFTAAVRQAGLLGTDAAAPYLHLCFLSSSACHVGLSLAGQRSPWPMGIPRLRFPSQAPSRSTLKLEEALHVFLGAAGQARELKAGMRAVDLGAAPGGWTWQLVRRGLHVSAIDNGPMDENLMASGLVEHRREDGFRYRPPQPVDWLVCDMVEQPARIARLIARWLADGDARQAIFNLKLPMKKRYAEVQRCREIIAETLAGRAYRLSLKQLYHDREEVTGWLRCSSR